MEKFLLFSSFLRIDPFYYFWNWAEILRLHNFINAIDTNFLFIAKHKQK